MKNLILFCFTLFTINTFASEPTVTVARYNKGLFGYKYLIETHTENSDQLFCREPGWNSCKFSSTSSENSGSLQAINNTIGIIDAQIDQGALSGSLSNGGIYATWTTDSNGKTQISIML